MIDDPTRVEWRQWGDGAFTEAQASDTPVLLSLTASWCDSCREMDIETYAEPRIAANINEWFMPIRVDIDRHPRVRERYNMGGFPSTVFCTPTGKLLTGAAYLGPDGMRQVIDSVRSVWDKRGADAGRVPQALTDDPTPVGTIDERIESHLTGQLELKWDDRFAGWGDNAKFPLPRTVEFALKRKQNQAIETLHVIAESLYDHSTGGFYRYADNRDWTTPHKEKILDTNAALIRAFVNGYLYTGEETLLDPAYGTQQFFIDQLWNGQAFGKSIAPQSEGESKTAESEATVDARRDLTAYAGSNALMADALLTLSAYTDNKTAYEYGSRVLGTLESTFIGDDGIVSHAGYDETPGELNISSDTAHRTEIEDTDPSEPILLLEDHARVINAFVTARQVLGPDVNTLTNDPVLVASVVADAAIDALSDANVNGDGDADADADGAFRDGPTTGPGLLDRPLRPLDGAIEMADALLKLGRISDTDQYKTAATDALAAFAGARDRLGVQVAGYGAVTARVTRPLLFVRMGAEAGSDLHRAALRIADHEAIVIPSVTDIQDGTAHLTRGSKTETATTPDEVMNAVSVLTH